MLVSLIRRAGRRVLPFPKAVSFREGEDSARRLYALAWPSLVENLLQTMLGVVDLIMVGRLGADAIAGVGLGTQILNLLLTMYTGLAVGNTALVARFVGARENGKAERAAQQALLLGAAVSLVIAVIGFFFSRSIITLLGGAPEVSDLGGRFLRIVSTGSATMMVMIIGGGTLRGSGDTRTPMLITGFINLINIAVSYVLIFGKFGFPALGVEGSALGMTLARAIGSGLIVWVLFGRGSVLKLDVRHGWGFDPDMLRRLADIGLPAAAEQVIFSLGFTLFAAITLSLGTAALAAQQIVFNIATFSFMPAFAFGIGATTLVGQNLGAHDPQRAAASAVQAWKSGLAWMCLMGLGFLVFRRPLVALYTDDPTVIQLASVLMLFLVAGQPLQATSIVLGSALRGAGDTRVVMFITMAGVWFMRLGVGYLVGIAFGLGLFGVWVGWMADFIVRALLVTWRYRSGRWKQINV
jgi:putative MATE family efflux protein